MTPAEASALAARYPHLNLKPSDIDLFFAKDGPRRTLEIAVEQVDERVARLALTRSDAEQAVQQAEADVAEAHGRLRAAESLLRSRKGAVKALDGRRRALVSSKTTLFRKIKARDHFIFSKLVRRKLEAEGRAILGSAQSLR